jgi:tetratricopeptide (TPR) repeat protein
MIFATLVLMQAIYSPETDAVMNRSRARAEERRAQERDQAEAQRVQKQNPAARGLEKRLPPAIAQKLQACLDVANGDPVAGIKFAQDWSLDGGGFSAGQCLGFANARAENWPQAVKAFDEAALSAQKEGAPMDAARLWSQAGNAALAGGDARRALGFLDAALGSGLPDDIAKGEIYLDRARAQVALDQLAKARPDIDAALKLAANDPLAWLLSATLARRMGDLKRARHDIDEAKRRSPDDSSVALEDGNIAVMAGDDAAAKTAWEKTVTLAPQTDQAAAARDNISRLAVK